MLRVCQEQKDLQERMGKEDKLDQLVLKVVRVLKVLLEFKDQQVALVHLDQQVLLDQQEILGQEGILEQEVILDYQGHRAAMDFLDSRDQEVKLVSMGSLGDLVQLEALVHRDQRAMLDPRVQLAIQDRKETEAAQGLRGLLVLKEQEVIMESKVLKVPQDNLDQLGHLDPLGQKDK